MRHTAEPLNDTEFIDFGELPDSINNLLQRGVVAYRHDRPFADSLFRQAMLLAPQQLPVYYCLYKIHTYQGNLDQALAIAEAGLREAGRQAGWGGKLSDWQPVPAGLTGPGRFAIYTLKALAFIHLRRGERDEACRVLEELSRLDPCGTVGWPVIAELARGSNA